MNTPEVYQRLFLKVSEVAKLLRADPRTVRRGIEEGVIPAVRIGSTIRIPTEAFLNLLGEVPAQMRESALDTRAFISAVPPTAKEEGSARVHGTAPPAA
ncbi:helix-turn-helix domain-containing protein [Kribbella deserti]|uniref:Helix-turn-helix domain-containing protein n=1 Tax=Kribbella deserti TaxID=1926257 RepID=A0ABV6QF91_9ACTN